LCCLEVHWYCVFRLLGKYDFAEMKFSLYFVGYEKAEDIPKEKDARTKWCFSRRGTIELTQYV
jgi:lactoylglutathione lyase